MKGGEEEDEDDSKREKERMLEKILQRKQGEGSLGSSEVGK